MIGQSIVCYRASMDSGPLQDATKRKRILEKFGEGGAGIASRLQDLKLARTESANFLIRLPEPGNTHLLIKQAAAKDATLQAKRPSVGPLNCLLLVQSVAVIALCLGPATAECQDRVAPVIDMHLHAETIDTYIANPRDTFWFPRDLRRPSSNDELMRRSIDALREHNVVYAVTSDDLQNVERWRKAAPERIIPAPLGMFFDAATRDSIRVWAKAKRIRVLGELVWMYAARSPSDSSLEPLWALAEELDLPLCIHAGPIPPGWTQLVEPNARIRLGNPLLLEDALVRHPRARVYVAHAGWPYLDNMVALLYEYPNVYVDISWIDWCMPRDEFYRYLERLVNAGFGDRIMFGSDQMQWPEAIGKGIDAVNAAPFLSKTQKRDILYNNAVRFLRLDSSGVSY